MLGKRFKAKAGGGVEWISGNLGGKNDGRGIDVILSFTIPTQ
jgi:hypothetical protein